MSDNGNIYYKLMGLFVDVKARVLSLAQIHMLLKLRVHFN